MLHLLRKKIPLTIKVLAVVLFGSLLLSDAAMAQDYSTVEKNMPDHDIKPYYFGLSIAITRARFQTELHPAFLASDSIFVAEPVNSGGISLGLSATARISDRFQLRFNPQLMLMERGINYKLKYPDIDGETDVVKKIESTIMSFPLQLKFQSDRIGNFRVYTLAGIRADIDMASNARLKRGEDLVKIQKYDWGPEFGIGFNFFFDSFIFSPEIKISNGMKNIHGRDENLKYSNVFDKIQSRMIVFTIHLEG